MVERSRPASRSAQSGCVCFTLESGGHSLLPAGRPDKCGRLISLVARENCEQFDGRCALMAGRQCNCLARRGLNWKNELEEKWAKTPSCNLFHARSAEKMNWKNFLVQSRPCLLKTFCTFKAAHNDSADRRNARKNYVNPAKYRPNLKLGPSEVRSSGFPSSCLLFSSTRANYRE